MQYAAKMGYKVVVLSSSGKKEAFAKELGANVYVDRSKEDPAAALQKLGGAAMIVITAPDMEGAKSLVGGLDKGGKLLVLGGEFLPSCLAIPPILPNSTSLWPTKTENSRSGRRSLHPLGRTRRA